MKWKNCFSTLLATFSVMTYSCRINKVTSYFIMIPLRYILPQHPVTVNKVYLLIDTECVAFMELGRRVLCSPALDPGSAGPVV